MLDAERKAWWKLSRAQGVNPKEFWALLKQYGGAEAALDAVLNSQSKTYVFPQEGALEKEFDSLRLRGGGIVFGCDLDYPPLLKQISDPPPVLSYLGNRDLLKQDLFAIVGGRNASLMGQRFAAYLAAGMGRSGYGIVSGLARGIDGAAHKASLRTGTVAVVAGGLDVIYPREHTALYQEILENQGLILAEMPLGMPPSASLFPRRNRSISGLSQGVLLIEASLQSGSLITARFAVEQGREVFAVPGFPTDTRHHGCHRLIRQGATLVECLDDILAEMPKYLAMKTKQTASGKEGPGVESALCVREPSEENSEEGFLEYFEEDGLEPLVSPREIILNALNGVEVDIEDLKEVYPGDAASFQVALFELEEAGQIQRLRGNRISRLYEVKI